MIEIMAIWCVMNDGAVDENVSLHVNVCEIVFLYVCLCV